MALNANCSLSMIILEYLNINLIINRTLLKILVITKLVSATKILNTKHMVKNLALIKKD